MIGNRKKVLAIPPDFTRKHSFAGPLTGLAEEYFGDSLTDVLPALGTHFPMTGDEISDMYPGVPEEKFRVHNWREDIITLGEVPGEYVSEVSGGAVSYPWPAQVNRLLLDGGFDLILVEDIRLCDQRAILEIHEKLLPYRATIEAAIQQVPKLTAESRQILKTYLDSNSPVYVVNATAAIIVLTAFLGE